MVQGQVKDPTTFKYLQMKVYRDALDVIIDEGEREIRKASRRNTKSKMTLQKLASLKVKRNQLRNESHDGVRRRGFENEHEVLDYSRQLFRDKLNQKVPILSDPKNPEVVHNIRKYFEFAHGIDQSPSARKISPEQIKLQTQEQEERVMRAMSERDNLKQSSSVKALQIMLEELHTREQRGQMNRPHMSASQKNAIAMKFVDLHSKVYSNQRLAMIDKTQA